MELTGHTNWLITAYCSDFNMSWNNKDSESKVENVNDQKKIKYNIQNAHQISKYFF